MTPSDKGVSRPESRKTGGWRVYLHLGSDLWNDVIPLMKESGLWDYVVWDRISRRGGHPDHCEHSRHLGPHSYRSIDPELYDQLHPLLYRFMSMYARNTRMNQSGYGTKNIHDFLDIFNIQVSYYARVFADENINLILFSRAPHTGADFVAYHVARALGVQTLILQKNRHLGRRFLHVFDMEDFGIYETSRVIAEKAPFPIEYRFEKELDYMTEFYARNGWRERIRDWPFYQFCSKVWRWRAPEEAWIQYRCEKTFRRFDRKLTNPTPDLEGNFVYFPLQYQPEGNTTSWGGVYDDQLLAIEQLSSRLPPDWRILVKENPQQIGYQRGKWFYERLGGIPQAELVPRTMDTYDLLRKSRFAATITGTIGWESITGGKPVLIFGPGAWYRSLPGVILFTERFQVEDVLETEFEHADLEEAMSDLLTRCGHGHVFWKDLERIAEADEALNARRVAESLTSILS